MDDLETQIRVWADARADRSIVVTADEVMVRSERTRRRGRTWAVLAGVGGIAAACVALIVVTGRAPAVDDVATRGPASGEAAPTSAARGEVVFEVLGVAEGAAEPVGSMRSAMSVPSLADLWERSGLDGSPPEIDLDQHVVVSMTIADDACPPTLTGFRKVGEVLEPTFWEPPTSCEEPLIPRTFVVSLTWSSTGSPFVLRLPADRVLGGEDVPLTVERGEAVAEPVRAPTGYQAGEHRVAQTGEDDLQVLTYGFVIPSLPQQGIPGSGINVAVFERLPASVDPTQPLAEVVDTVWGQDADVRIEVIAGYEVAVERTVERPDGAPEAFPERRLGRYLLLVDGVMVEVYAHDDTPGAVEEIIGSFDVEQARDAIAAIPAD